MNHFELSPSEDARFDHMVDVENKSADDAWRIIEMERYSSIGKKIVDTVEHSEPKSTPSYTSRRGGRAYPEPSDSELDPYWNSPAELPDPAVIEEGKDAFEALAEEVRGDAIKSLANRTGMTEVEAAARLKAKNEIRNRS